MIIRIFNTAIDPEEADRVRRIHRQVLVPAFARFAGCHGIEMGLSLEEHSRDLVLLVAISQWDSVAAIQQATSSAEYAEAVSELRALFQENPIVRHFESAG
ncbi:MAG: antibiotic biosynthesis monooxygenase [Actinobacteria bacterium]|nr:antibiotic biosynthesis monooxygenase [Actinomycetota bacterium]